MTRILISFMLIPVLLSAKGGDTTVNKFFLSHKIKTMQIRDTANNLREKIDFARSGVIRSIVTNKTPDSVLHTEFYASGNLRRTFFMVNGKTEGEMRFYENNKDTNRLKAVYVYKNNMYNGQNIDLKYNFLMQKYDTLFIVNFADDKQYGPTIVNYGNQYLITYFFRNKDIITFTYYSDRQDLRYYISKKAKRRMRKYKLDINKIVEACKIYFPGVSFYLNENTPAPG